MRLRHLAALLALCTATLVQAQTPKAMGYVGWWLPDGWRTLPQQRLQSLLFFDVGILADGTLADRHGWPEQWSELQQFATDREIPIEISLTLMDAAVFHRLFSNSAAVEQLLAQTIVLASHASVAGLHLDVEMYVPLDNADIWAYRKFVQMLSLRLNEMQPRRTLSVFLPFQSQSILYDKASLQDMHHVVVQGYDAHWLDSKTAGPVAPLDGPYALTWKNAVAYADALGIPRQRQYMGYPLYGYEWKVRGNATQGRGVTTSFAPHPPRSTAPQEPQPVSVIERVARYGAVFDPVSASSVYRFRTPDGQRWEGWFDDWWGMRKKSDYLVRESLGGIAFFLLGYDAGILVQSFLQPARPTGTAPQTPTSQPAD